MSTEQNKAVVRRFMTEVLTGRNLGLADEVLAPNYVNRWTGADRAAFKGMLTSMRSALTDLRFEMDDLVAKVKRRGKFVKGERLFPDKAKMNKRLAAISQRKADPETTEETKDHDHQLQSEEENEIPSEPRAPEGQE